MGLLKWTVVLCTWALVTPPVVPKSLVLAGGGTGCNNAVWEHIIELAGGSQARIGVISAASSTPEDSASYYVDLFLDKGVAESVWIPVHEGNLDANSDPEVIAEIRRMTGFFFSGGDQERIINSFYLDGRVESPALTAIREVYEDDGVMSGDSAGSACQGRPPMITGGYSWESCVYGAYEINDPGKPQYTVEYDPEGGIGMLNDFIVDSHFSDRGREGRLARLVADTMDQPLGRPYAIGLDEGTSLVITNVDTAQASGEVVTPTVGFGGVWVVDMSDAQRVTGQQCWHMRNINTHYVTEGDVISLGTGNFEINYASFKNNIVGDEYYNDAATSKDVFYGNGGDYHSRAEYTHVACRLMDCLQTQAHGSQSKDKNPEYEVNFDQEASTEAYGGYSPTTDKFLISYRNLKVEMKALDGQDNNNNCDS